MHWLNHHHDQFDFGPVPTFFERSPGVLFDLMAPIDSALFGGCLYDNTLGRSPVALETAGAGSAMARWPWNGR